MKKLDPVKIAKDLISLKSYEGANEPYIYIKGLLESHGAKVQEIESKGVKSIHATIGEGKEMAEIGFNGHYDTVHPVLGWDTDPLKPVIKDGNLYGLGASDMKGSLASMLVAYLELARAGPKKKIIFQAVGDEEVGGENGTKVMVDRGMVAKRMVVGEPSGNNVGYAHKGLLRAEIKTIGRAAHASRTYAGESAILNMNTLINTIAYDNFLKMKCTKENVEEAITCNIGKINGGRTINVVPDDCSMLLDIRVPHTNSLDEVERYLKQITGEKGTVDIRRKSEGMYTKPDDPFILTCQKIAIDVIKKGVKLSYALGSCDGRYFTYKGIPTVKMGACGFNAEGHRMFHIKNEFVGVEDLRTWSEIFRRVAWHYVFDPEKSDENA
ncbi:ArgE/DapE family deacylase [Candidatus Micrarchaeota archaeon]|nr:ArgE/DapE family deacylase [Candidatus Micrarchaeota archaeon]MBU1165693.1 ArgE/DapE family deacylase [Candidatus Micrarchaeota archaeon]MBU1887065.1 ArgE/DapE family deacylase [Candidatus Micrarchaeota archaeon]